MVTPKPVLKPPPPTPEVVSEVEMVEEEYKQPSVAEAKKLFDRPDEYQPPPAKVSKPSKPLFVPTLQQPPVPQPVYEKPYVFREKSPRLFQSQFIYAFLLFNTLIFIGKKFWLFIWVFFFVA